MLFESRQCFGTHKNNVDKIEATVDFLSILDIISYLFLPFVRPIHMTISNLIKGIR